MRILFISLLVLAGCSKPETQSERIAEWQDEVITRSDFERSYYQFWQSKQMKDSPELRRQFARQMIEQELIADRGRFLHLDTLYQIRSMVRRDQEKFIRRRYLEIFLKDTIPSPDDTEVSTAMQRLSTKLFVRQIYGQTPEEVQLCYHFLQQDSAINGNYHLKSHDQDTEISLDTLGWIRWGETDLPVENILFSLKRGEISAPVQSLMGWHLFIVDSILRTVQFDPPSPQERENVRWRLLDRKFDLAVATYTRNLLWSRELNIDISLFAPVWSYLSPIFNMQAQSLAATSNMSGADIFPRELAEKVMARIDGEPFLVGDFISSLPDLPRNVIRPNLKKAIEIAIRDKILSRIALEAGLEKDPVVAEKIHRQLTTYLYYKTLQQESSQIQFSADDLKKYYAANRNKYIKKIETEIFEILVAQPDSARALAKRLQAGEEFNKLVSRYSLRKGSRTNGGYLGFIPREQEPFGRIAATLKEGDIYAPVKTSLGYSIIRTGKKRLEYSSFSDVQSDILKDIQKARLELILRNLLPPNYQPQNIIFYPEILKKVFTDRKTIF